MEGTLDETPLPEVLQKLCASRSSGVLHLSRGNTTKRVYFKSGSIVFASSSESGERLGERLVRSGAIKRSDLELACRITASSRMRLGTTLVEMGYLSRDELDVRVKEQVSSIIHSLLPWDSGVFRTEPKEEPVASDLARKDLSTPKLLLEGVRLIRDFDRIRQGIGDLGGRLSYAVDPTRIPADLELTPEEGFVLSRVDGATSAEEIAKLSPLGEEETLRCVYALVAARILEVKRRSDGPSAPAASARAPSPEALRFLEEMREKRRRFPELTHYDILEVEPGAVPEAIKAAYFRLVKRLHPDQRANLGVEDPEGVLAALYLKVNDAYDVLSSETERRRYDFALSQKAKRHARAEATAAANPKRGESEVVEPVKKEIFTNQQSARIHFGNGERFFHDGRFHEAIEELRTAVRLDGAKAEYHRLLGRALAKNPKWRKQAEESLWRALDINRFDAESYLELGDLYLSGGMGTKAKKMFEEALAVDPDSSRAMERLFGRRKGRSTLQKLKGIIHRTRGD